VIDRIAERDACAQGRGDPGKDAPDVVTDRGHDGVDDITLSACKVLATYRCPSLLWPMTGATAERAW
jgi:hypothetical protein